jgi:hypothetical protein
MVSQVMSVFVRLNLVIAGWARFGQDRPGLANLGQVSSR